MASYYSNVGRWIGRLLHGEDRQDLRGKIWSSGDSIYSYGTHFEMARLLRDGKGQPQGFLVNGDRASVTTDRHQAEVRRNISATNLDSVIIPFSALEASGVNFDTVEIIDTLPERWVEKKFVTNEMPVGARWVDKDIDGYRDLTDEELHARVDETNKREAGDFQRHVGYALQEQAEIEAGKERGGLWSRYLDPEAKPKVITVDDLDHWQRSTYTTLRVERVLQRSNFGGEIDVTVLEDGTTEYRWTTRRHWLGESLIRAKVPRTGTTNCKACNGTGRTDPDPMDELADRDNVGWDTRLAARRLGTCPQCEGRGGKRWTRNRTAYFLSGFDHNETREVYFFCELPQGIHPTTVDEAYEDLKPDAVKLAEQMGRTVHRQGDIFAIELRGINKRELRTKGARFEKRGNLLNTNHEATEVAYLPDGSTLVRGTLWHNPEWRTPDHKRVTVGKAWHLTVKNTVPVTR